jgi:hypothetical protein
MKVKVGYGWVKDLKVCELADVIVPGYSGYDGGVLEQVENKADETAKAMGRLLATLVDSHALTLEQAKNIAGIYHEITEVTE